MTTNPVLEESCLWRLEAWEGLGLALEFKGGLLYARLYLLHEPDPVQLAQLQQDLTEDALTFELPAPEWTVTALPQQDWATSWMQFWKPRLVGDQFIICPVWLLDQLAVDNPRMVLKLDAGLAFGTGEHETSRLCLVALERWLKPGQTIADIGCGSGILTIGALLLGAGPAQAVDLEEQSVRATQMNLAHNHVTARVVQGSTEQILGPVDGVLCNILAPVILQLLPQIEPLVVPGGWTIFSGTLVSQLPEIIAALGDRWQVMDTLTEGQWAALVCQRT